MFQSVIEQHEWRTRRLGMGASVSVLVHAGIFTAAVVLSTGVVEQIPKELPEIVFKQPAPRGNPNPPATKAVVEPPKPRTKPQALVQPAVIPVKPPKESDPPPETKDEPSDDDMPYDPNGKLDGLAGAAPCVACEAIKGATLTSLQPTGEDDSVPYINGIMTLPRLVSSGEQIEYTREALAARVTGLLTVKCVITQKGEVEHCRIIKGLPYMNEAVLSALETRRYTPVHYQGRPTSVSYIFNIKLDMPRYP